MSDTMTNGSELLRRVNEAMSGTIQEQLKELVVAARTGIEQFSDAAAQQGTLLADAHAGIVDSQERLGRAVDEARTQLSEDFRIGMQELSRAREADKHALGSVVDDLARKVTALDGNLTDAIEVLRSNVEAMHNAAEVRAQQAFSTFTAQMEWQMTAMDNELQKRVSEMQQEFAGRAAALENAIESSAAQAESARANIVSRIEFLERAMKDVRAQMEQTTAENTARFNEMMKKLENTSGIEERAAHHLVTLLGGAIGTITSCEPEMVQDAEIDPMSA